MAAFLTGTRISLVLAVVTGATASAVLGCARAESAADRQLHQLQEEIRHVQAERDRLDARLASLEMDSAQRHGSAPTVDVGGSAGGGEAPAHEERRDDVRESAANGDTPALRVIRLRPGGEPELRPLAGGDAPRPASEARPGGDRASAKGRSESGTDDPAPRPTIRVTGAVGGARMHAPDRVEQTVVDEGAPPPPARPRSSALDPEARRAYEDALAMVRRRSYDKALDAFAGFLVRWPDHPYADNALYWRGECYFAQGEFARAVEQFEGTVHRFPVGNKVPDALLKLGMSQQKLGAATKAREAFEKLGHEHPQSEAARRIPREETP